MIAVEPHPLLDAVAFISRFSTALGDVRTSAEVTALSAKGSVDGARIPLVAADDSVRSAVRDLLRHGGYKPTGRGKPSSEYLLRAVAEGALGSINAAVDACNAASLHSGLPISVIDLERARAPLSIAISARDARYVFNASGQEIDLGGLLCLCDADGPCANAVKDAQRTKTRASTTTTLSVVWGTRALPERSAQTASWYRRLVEDMGATTSSAS